MSAASSLIVPDLRYLTSEQHEAFELIVLRGALVGNGMPSFEGLLPAEDLPALHGYIVSQAHKAYDEQNQPAD